jgi:tetratricopeptide (TPR) repeat protein
LLHHVPGKGIALVLDDYQHADDELRGVVDALCSSRTPIPVVVVCPCRTDDLHAASSADDCVVPPLDDDAVTTLVCAALGAPPPQPVVDALLSRAEGRPLAALQSSAYLVETGTVAIEDDRCVVVHPQRLSDLPDSMRLFVAGRLDRLPPSDKQLLQELSAVGTSVDLDVVTRLFGADAAQLATGLVARGFLVHEGDRLRFSHGVVHEVAYAALPRSVRARLHRRIVEEDPIGDVAVRAAHARRWLATASEASPDERQHAAAAALHHTRVHAQQLYTEHVRNAYAEARTVRGLLEDDSDVAPADAASLLVLLASCDINAGRYDDALAGAVRAVDLCRHHEVDPSLLVAALCTRGEALSMLRHYQSARQALDEALHIAGAHDDHVGRGRALRLLGDTYRHSDSNRLLALTEEAYDVLSACGDEHGAAEAARSMAYWLSVSTAPRLARWLDEAERRTPARDVRGRLELARTAAFAAGARLDAAVAREHARTCRALGVELGIGDAIVDGLMSGIESAAALGLLDESIALLDELEDYARSRAEPRVRQMAAVVGLQPLQRTGQTARARDARAQAVALRDAFGPPETMMAAAALGLAARDRGAWSEALDHLQLAVEAGDAAGFSLSALVLRHEIVLTSAFVGVVALDAVEVAEHAEAGGAPIIAASIRAALGLAAARPPDAGDTWTLQEEAVRADAVALHLESRDDDASGAWADSIAAWRPLGHTVFLARALARSGAREDAEHTLDLVEATAEGRAWALQR